MLINSTASLHCPSWWLPCLPLPLAILGLHHLASCLSTNSGHFVKKLVSNSNFVSTYVRHYLIYILTLFQKSFYTTGIQSKNSKPDSPDLKSNPCLLVFRSYAVQLNKNTQHRLCSAILTHPLSLFCPVSPQWWWNCCLCVNISTNLCIANRSCSSSMYAREAHFAGSWSTSSKYLESSVSHTRSF